MTAADPSVTVLPALRTDGLHLAGDQMSAPAARLITERLRAKLTDLKQDVLRAYEGLAHLALGYNSWESYVDGELGINRQYTYRLMEAARAERALARVVADRDPELPVAQGDTINLSERTCRGIDIDEAMIEVSARLGRGVDIEGAIAVFRQVADEQRQRPPEPDESVVDADTRHLTDLRITQITDPKSGGTAWLWESLTGWNRGWVRIVRTADPRDILAAWSEIQVRYRQHLRGEMLEGAELSLARSRATTHDPVDWQGPIERDGIIGWLAPSGHFYPREATACRKMLAKRLALGLPT